MAIDLKKLMAQPGIEKAAPRPCPKCGERDAGGPCYGFECGSYNEPDFDCRASIPQDCDDCFYIWCDECKKKHLIAELFPEHSVVPTKYLHDLEEFAKSEGINDCTCPCCVDMRGETRALFPDLFGEWKNDDT